jgi:hypothetical protein
MSVWVACASFSSPWTVRERDRGVVAREVAQQLPARAVLVGEADGDREIVDAGLARVGAVAVLLQPEEALRHQGGERVAVLALGDLLELLAERGPARIEMGLGLGDHDRLVGLGGGGLAGTGGQPALGSGRGGLRRALRALRRRLLRGGRRAEQHQRNAERSDMKKMHRKPPSGPEHWRNGAELRRHAREYENRTA